MTKLKYTHGPAPVFTVLAESHQSGEPSYRLCVLPIPGQDFYVLLREYQGQQSSAYITAESALELLNEPYFQKTMRGAELLVQSQPLKAAPKQIDLSSLR